MVKQKNKRVGLAHHAGQRIQVRGVVGRRGSKSGFKGPVETLLINQIASSDGIILTDHMWFTAGKWSANLMEGQHVEFNATVGTYTRGYEGRRDDVYVERSRDYRLERPTRVRIIGQAQEDNSSNVTINCRIDHVSC